MFHRNGSFYARLLCGAAAVAIVSTAGAFAQERSNITIEPQPLATALNAFGAQTGSPVISTPDLTAAKVSGGVRDADDPAQALAQLLSGTGLSYRCSGDTYLIIPAPQGQPAPGVTRCVAQSGAGGSAADDVSAVEALIVTAQKREENIQDVPIAISAFSAESLDAQKIEGGAELLRAVPNVTFSKANFSMYNFSIRGIGTKAISAGSDPAVAISFNNTPLIRNRLFEQEYLDVARVEVLRGPQGTLYGRNATAGVVNMIPALPSYGFDARVKVEAGNFDSRRASAMINLPFGDSFAVRAAGALTRRDGFDYNTFTETRVNGRDLWSGRLSARWDPSERVRANVIWEHFEEDDNRSRTGKQLCTTDPGLTMVGDIVVPDLFRGKTSQGCLPGSLYDDAAFGAPNGEALVYLTTPSNISLGYQYDPNASRGRGPNVPMMKPGDPFASVRQSRNLREIATGYDPVFRAKNDVVQVNLEFDLTEELTLVSQTAHARDRYYSTQDYNRFITDVIFNNSTRDDLVNILGVPIDTEQFPGPTPGGLFCDPQLGCSDRMVSADISRSRNRQWSQEFRLQSDFDGAINFSLGANYLDFKSKDDYYVFNNMFTLIAQWYYDSSGSPRRRNTPDCDLGFEGRECPYVDPNPIESLDNQGHNYFLSQNGVRTKSGAVFGEVYWEIADDLKLTLGARYTRDRKLSDQIPSQLLLAGGIDNPWGPLVTGDITGGRVNSGYPALPDIKQSWTEFTGRAVLDWRPELDFTDETMVYLSAARGYKGGGVNPPRVDFNPAIVQYLPLPQTFRPEYVNAFEAGAKNSLADGRLMLNVNAFFYDYKDYQISQIVDRIAYNENFDATSMGVEFEAAWRPTRAFRIDANLGILKTRLKKGSESIDVMNRTQGDPEWILLRPWLQVPSNCIAPRAFVEKVMDWPVANIAALAGLCPGATRVGNFNPAVTSKFQYFNSYGFTYDFLAPYNPDTVGLNVEDGGSGAPNGGRGFAMDLTDHELPNAPRWTLSVGTQYTFILPVGWDLTLRGDYYRQAKSYGRIYNTDYDLLKAWENLNLSMTFQRPESGMTVQAYVKNVFDDAPITDFFTNSDDTGLTTNVFTLDPRLVGVSVTKTF